MLLAIDASTRWASLAIMDDHVVCCGLDWQVGRQHSVEIFGQLEWLFRSAGITSDELTAIAVATGPGSFNGTRVAVTVAKTLAFVWQLPLVGMPTLAGIAQSAVIADEIGLSFAAQSGSVLSVLEAGRDELYFCWYDLHVQSIAYPDIARPASDHSDEETFRDVAFVRPKGAIMIAQVVEIAASAPTGPLLLCGEASEAHQAALSELLGARLQIQMTPQDPNHTRANGLGRLAQLRLAVGDHDDVLALEPSYVRRPNITTSKRHPLPPGAGA